MIPALRAASPTRRCARSTAGLLLGLVFRTTTTGTVIRQNGFNRLLSEVCLNFRTQAV